MKISIGLRLFASVLLAILAVAASAVFLLRQDVLERFGDYAAQVELDRLEELSATLARRYARSGSWDFIPAAHKRAWLADELARLEQERAMRVMAAPAPPAPPAPPAAPAAPAPRAPVSVAPPRSALPVVPVAPAAPAAPSAPPLPPLPPPPSFAMPHPDDLAPRLQARASLLGPDGRWLAGREPGTLPLVRRAILVDGKTVGYLAVARSARPTDALAYAFLQQLGASLWPIAAAGVLLSAPVATALAIHFRRPIGRLAAGARLLAEGRFDTRLPLGRSDELGELAGHFNALAARLEAAEATRRQWVADTSHELRTPLAVLRAQIEAIQDGVRNSDPEHVAAMLRQCSP
ncbi:HAMP domain-containing protein [Massilia sp. Dwa41.01b]|uniref:HAMP domain-containing protein n=1 Tax=Massilia sp. Dwa41.01b TaxID=2709302 RepID=UPI00160332D3|nr:HAMP domain-containing protein [Massilia sp. Dwa41.01b]QNA89824.1 HAMP domain-containing protein [Massilia sp. Dwa41.01b]